MSQFTNAIADSRRRCDGCFGPFQEGDEIKRYKGPPGVTYRVHRGCIPPIVVRTERVPGDNWRASVRLPTMRYRKR